MKINGNKIVKASSFEKRVCNNMHGDIRNFKEIYVYEDVGEDSDNWAEFGFVKLKHIKGILDALKTSSQWQADKYELICADDGTKLIQLWWD